MPKLPAAFWSGLWTIVGAVVFVGAIVAFATGRFGVGIALTVATLVCVSGSWHVQRRHRIGRRRRPGTPG